MKIFNIQKLTLKEYHLIQIAVLRCYEIALENDDIFTAHQIEQEFSDFSKGNN